ncbi:MAG: response regulator [Nitrospiraceae bacterium]|nr:response regulator [Nitrospiraceae bacterium]
MPLKILIVDDDPMMLNLYPRMLCGQDYSITLAAGVAAATALIRENHYDLFITDLMLGDGLGTELTRLFAKKFPGAKSLIVSGSLTEAGDMDLSTVTECLPKPLQVDRFIAAVCRALAAPERTTCESYA